MVRLMRSKVWLALLVAGFAAGGAGADDVHLTNGESFEGVIAERLDEHVVIRLEFGELKLPMSSVARIETSYSPLSDFLLRRRALRSRQASALEWLELARWSRSQDLPHGYRESLLEAAAIEPTLDQLAPSMRDLNYVFDAELDRWIPYAEHLRRTQPVPRQAEAASGQDRGTDARPASDDHREVEEALSRTVELLALAELARETRETQQTTAHVGPSVQHGFPVAHFPGGFFFGPVTQPTGDVPAEGEAQPIPVTSQDLFRRPPGSLIPVGGANRGVRFRQPGSLLPVKSSGR